MKRLLIALPALWIGALPTAAQGPNTSAATPLVQPAVPSIPAPGPTIADKRLANEEQAPVLTVQEAIALALQNNPTRAQARAALEAAQSRIGTARSQGGPQVGLSGTVGYDRNFGQPDFNFGGNNGGNAGNDVSFTNNGFTQSAGINASIPLYTGGRVKAGTRQAEALARQQAALAVQTEQDIVYNTAVGYLAVLRAEQILAVEAANLAVSVERLRIARVRYDAGAAARLDVLRAENTVADARLRRVNAANSLALTKANLNTVMGRAPETPLRLVSLDTVEAPAGDTASFQAPLDNLEPQTLRNLAEKNRAVLVAAQEQVNAALANVDVAKSQRKPSLSTTLSGLLRNPVTFLGRFALSAGLNVAQTLFDSGRAKSQIAEANALVAQARAGQDVQRQQVAFELERLILNVDAAQRKLDTTDTAVVTAREALRAVQIGYQAGARTSVEVTDAQTALLAAQTEAINARFDLANARAQLASAVGLLSKEWQIAYEAALRQEIGRIRAVTK
jgi:outer membrane protein TolC